MKLTLFNAALLAAGVASASTAVDNKYVSVFGGYTYLSSNIDTYYYGHLLYDVHYFDGYNAGGSVGFQSNPMRYEFQYTYLYADTDRYKVDNRTLLRIDGGTKANVLMGNIYYDFPEMLHAITPFLGVGVGYALMHATLNSTSRFKRPHFNTRQDSFAYQGIAGLTYNFSNRFAINAAYRYLATANNDTWGKPLQAQMADVGLVYRF
jgi:opacity protein-like surface antigen